MKAIRTISIILVFLLLLIISNTSCSSTDVDRTKSDLDVEKIDEPKIIVDDIPNDIQDFEIDTQE